MAWDDPDVYGQPEKFGLTIIGELDDPDACWSFDYLVAWQHEDGRVFYAQDSGCSCPSPFEDFTSLDDLIQITPASWAAFELEVKMHCNYENRDWGPDGPDELAAKRTELLAKVSRLI